VCGSNDEYAEAAGLLPSFPEKAKPKDPILCIADACPPSPCSCGEKRSRKLWSVREKLKWARHYKELGSLKKTSNEFSASIAFIQRWAAKAASGVNKGVANCRKRLHGAGPHHLDIKAALQRYICLELSKGVAISVKDTQKRSRNWMKKHHPDKNWNMINPARHNIDLARIINADQTPLFVEMPAKRTLDHRDARSVPIRTVGYEKTRLTMMLASTASLEKVRPWMWFKMKNVPKCDVPEGLVVQAQDNGWMDEDAVKTWLTREVLPHLNLNRGQNTRRGMLVLDSYRGHITQGMLQAYRTHSINPAIIPAGCTSQIQPGVSINRCFKLVEPPLAAHELPLQSARCPCSPRAARLRPGRRPCSPRTARLRPAHSLCRPHVTRLRPTRRLCSPRAAHLRPSRDAAARLAIRNHLPLAECAHFGQHKTAKALYDAVVAHYSSPATAALGRLILPYLFPEQSAFATVEDLVTHLRTSDARYCAALPAEFLDKNPPPPG
ncbi:unnamed protein product, partial [Closterium sp. NIES-53]